MAFVSHCLRPATLGKRIVQSCTSFVNGETHLTALAEPILDAVSASITIVKEEWHGSCPQRMENKYIQGSSIYLQSRILLVREVEGASMIDTSGGERKDGTEG
jgi:hypothetical protein